MKEALLAVILFSAFSTSAQNSMPVFANAPLSKKSIGKQFDRSAIVSALPMHNLEGKYILIDVFFQACGPCRASIPYLNEMADSTKYPQLQVVSIDPFREDSATMDKFISHFKIRYPVITGQLAYDIGSLIKNKGYPFAVLLDPSGKIIEIKLGFSEEGFENLKRKLKDDNEVKKDKEVMWVN